MRNPRTSAAGIPMGLYSSTNSHPSVCKMLVGKAAASNPTIRNNKWTDREQQEKLSLGSMQANLTAGYGTYPWAPKPLDPSFHLQKTGNSLALQSCPPNKSSACSSNIFFIQSHVDIHGVVACLEQMMEREAWDIPYGALLSCHSANISGPDVIGATRERYRVFK